MPFKYIDDKRRNRLLYERTLSLKRFRAMGVEPIDINDQASDLVCLECFKFTPRTSSRSRHEVGCSKAGPTLLRYPVDLYA